MPLAQTLRDVEGASPQQSTSAPGAFQVVVLQPAGYPHVAAFSEIIETVAWGLQSLGAQVSIGLNRLVVPGPTPILFGANLLEPHEVGLLPADTVIYNLEQVSESSPWCTPQYLNALRRCQVWDYSARNIASLARMGVATARHVPIGYSPWLTRITPAATEDIDVLFYGSMNERRSRLITRLSDAGLNVQAVFGVYGQARDNLISRAKVVLNAHYYDTGIFELVRVSYLLANRKAVVAECDAATEIEPDVADAVRLAPYDGLTQACSDLVFDDEKRSSLAEKGFARMSARNEALYLGAVLDHQS